MSFSRPTARPAQLALCLPMGLNVFHAHRDSGRVRGRILARRAELVCTRQGGATSAVRVKLATSLASALTSTISLEASA